MLGIPFREAATRLAALVKEQDELPDTPEADARSDEITEQWEVLGRAILGSIPRTPADSVAVIDTALCPAIGPNMDRTVATLFQRVRGVLVQAALDAVQREEGSASKATGGEASTMIPGIGLTFTEAAQQIADLVRDGLYHKFEPLEDALLAAQPVTPLDLLAVIDRLLCPEIGLVGEGHRHALALQRVRKALDALFVASVGRATSTVIPSLGLTFRDAVDRCLNLIAQQNSTPTDTEEGEARADAIAVQWIRLADKLLSAVPVNMADGAAIADLLLDDCAGLPNAGVHGAKLVAFSHLRDLLARQGVPASETESFSAGVAAFDGAAAKALCMPTAPTLAMIEAGAAAGGIDPEQARAIYAAMAAAFVKEAA
ncbi:hypothetical protein D3093_11655 [Azospirillum argentinense]|uniref:Uncharacterized protein n=2 Tax=Azospirillum argentinense TaxID=2970906 RepID=A0A4D8PKE2_9PROT|nr:hypothetical protein D3093_11655 [Azospirillum argentinense]